MKQLLHLVRPGARPDVVADHDWVVYLDPLQLAERGTPPVPHGPIDHDQLIALAFTADLVITW